MNLRLNNLYLIFWLLNTVTVNVGFIPQLNLKENPELLKTLQTVDDASSDVTFNLITSLCSCLREKLKKHKTFNGETNLLLADDEPNQESDISFYKYIYNRTCSHLHHSSKDNNSKIVKDIVEIDLNPDLKDEIRPIKEFKNLNEHEFPREKEYRLLYDTIIKDINNHTYTIQKYPLYKHKVISNSADERSVIVIITLNLMLNNSSLLHNFYSVNDVNETLNRNSLVDIHIIDAMFTNQYERISTVKKCHLYSLYIFIIESERKNSIKNFKLLRVKGTLKIFINILSNLNLKNFPDQCCNKSLLKLCENRINTEKNVFTNTDPIKHNAKRLNSKNVENIISKIENLITLYNAKLIRKEISNTKFVNISGNISKYLPEKSDSYTAILSSIDTDNALVPQNFTTEKYFEITAKYSNEPTKSNHEKAQGYYTSQVIAISQKDDRKPKIVENIEINSIVNDNSAVLIPDQIFHRNQSIDITEIDTNTRPKFSVTPSKFPLSVDLENITPVLLLGDGFKATGTKYQNNHTLKTETPTLSTIFNEINVDNKTQITMNKLEPSLTTYIKTNESTTSHNSVTEQSPEENAQSNIITHKESNSTVGNNLEGIPLLSNQTIDSSIEENQIRVNHSVTPTQFAVSVDHENYKTMFHLSKKMELQNSQMLQTTISILSTSNKMNEINQIQKGVYKSDKFLNNKVKNVIETTSIIIPIIERPLTVIKKPKIMEKMYSKLTDNSTTALTKNIVFANQTVQFSAEKNFNKTTLVINETVNLPIAVNEIRMNLSVTPLQFTAPQDLENSITVFPLSTKMRLQNTQMLQTSTSLLSTSYKMKEENETQVDMKKYGPSLTNYKNINLNPQVLETSTITETDISTIDLPKNTLMANQTIKFTAEKDLNKTRIESIYVSPNYFVLPVELKNDPTVMTLSRATDTKLNNKLETSTPTLFTLYKINEDTQRQMDENVFKPRLSSHNTTENTSTFVTATATPTQTTTFNNTSLGNQTRMDANKSKPSLTVYGINNKEHKSTSMPITGRTETENKQSKIEGNINSTLTKENVYANYTYITALPIQIALPVEVKSHSTMLPTPRATDIKFQNKRISETTTRSWSTILNKINVENKTQMELNPLELFLIKKNDKKMKILQKSVTGQPLEEDTKPKMIKSMEDTLTVDDNPAVISLLTNQNEIGMNDSVTPIQFTPSGDLKSNTTMLNLSTKVTLQNTHMLHTTTPIVSTLHKIKNEIQTGLEVNKYEPSLPKYDVNNIRNKTVNFFITVRPLFKNIKPQLIENINNTVTGGSNSTTDLTKNTLLTNQNIKLTTEKNLNITKKGSINSYQFELPVELKNHTTMTTLLRTSDIHFNNMFNISTPSLFSLYKVKDDIQRQMDDNIFEPINVTKTRELQKKNGTNLLPQFQNKQILATATPTLFTTFNNISVKNQTKMEVNQLQPLSIMYTKIKKTATTLQKSVTAQRPEKNTKLNIIKSMKDTLTDNPAGINLLSNQTIDLLKPENEIGIDLSVTPIQFSVSKNFVNYTTVYPLSTKLKLKNMQMPQTTYSILSTSHNIDSENQTQTEMNKFEPSLTVYAVYNNIENKSTIFPITGPKFFTENVQRQIIENSTITKGDISAKVLTINNLLANKTMNLSSENDLNITRVQNVSVSPFVPEELKNHATMMDVSRPSDISLNNINLLQTAIPTLFTLHKINEDNEQIDANIFEPLMTTQITLLNKNINMISTVRKRSKKENINPNDLKNVRSTLRAVDNSKNDVDSLLTKNDYSNNFLKTSSSKTYINNNNNNKQLNLDRGSNKMNENVSLSSEDKAEMEKNKLTDVTQTLIKRFKKEKESQKYWFKFSNSAVKPMNANNKLDEITNYFVTTQMAPLQDVTRSFSFSKYNTTDLIQISNSINDKKHKNSFTLSHISKDSNNNVVKYNNDIFLNITPVPSQTQLNNYKTVLELKRGNIKNYTSTLTKPMSNEVNNLTTLLSVTLKPLLKLPIEENQIETPIMQNLSNNSIILNMGYSDKLQNYYHNKTAAYKDKNNAILISHTASPTNISYRERDSNTNMPLLPKSKTNIRVINPSAINRFSKNTYMKEEIPYDTSDLVPQVPSHYKYSSQQTVHANYLLLKTTTQPLYTIKKQRPKILKSIMKDNQMINQSGTDLVLNKSISPKLKHQLKTYNKKSKYNELTTPIDRVDGTLKLNQSNILLSEDSLTRQNFSSLQKSISKWRQAKNDTINIIKNLDNRSKVIPNASSEQTSDITNTLSFVNIEDLPTTHKIRIGISITPLHKILSVDPKHQTTVLALTKATNKLLQEVQLERTSSFKINEENQRLTDAKKFDSTTETVSKNICSNLTLENHLKGKLTENIFSTKQTTDSSVMKNIYNTFNLFKINNKTKSSTVENATAQISVKYLEQLNLDNVLQTTNNYEYPVLLQKQIKMTPCVTYMQNNNNNLENTTVDAIERSKKNTYHAIPSNYNQLYQTPRAQKYSSTLINNVRNTNYESIFHHQLDNPLNGVRQRTPVNNRKLTTSNISNTALEKQFTKSSILIPSKLTRTARESEVKQSTEKYKTSIKKDTYDRSNFGIHKDELKITSTISTNHTLKINYINKIKSEKIIFTPLIKQDNLSILGDSIHLKSIHQGNSKMVRVPVNTEENDVTYGTIFNKDTLVKSAPPTVSFNKFVPNMEKPVLTTSMYDKNAITDIMSASKSMQSLIRENVIIRDSKHILNAVAPFQMNKTEEMQTVLKGLTSASVATNLQNINKTEQAITNISELRTSSTQFENPLNTNKFLYQILKTNTIKFQNYTLLNKMIQTLSTSPITITDTQQSKSLISFTLATPFPEFNSTAFNDRYQNHSLHKSVESYVIEGKEIDNLSNELLDTTTHITNEAKRNVNVNKLQVLNDIDSQKRTTALKFYRTPMQSLTTKHRYTKTLNLKLADNFVNFKPTIIIYLKNDTKNVGHIINPDYILTSKIESPHAGTGKSFQSLEKMSQYNKLGEKSSNTMFKLLPKDNIPITLPNSLNIPVTEALPKLTFNQSNNNTTVRSLPTTISLKHKDVIAKNILRNRKTLSKLNMIVTDLDIESTVTPSGFYGMNTENYKLNKSSFLKPHLLTMHKFTLTTNSPNNLTKQNRQIFKNSFQSRNSSIDSMEANSTIEENESRNILKTSLFTKNTPVLPFVKSTPVTIETVIRNISLLNPYTPRDDKIIFHPRSSQFSRIFEKVTEAISMTMPSSIANSLYYANNNKSDPYYKSKNTLMTEKDSFLKKPLKITSFIISNNNRDIFTTLPTMPKNSTQTKNNFKKYTLIKRRYLIKSNEIVTPNIKINRNFLQKINFTNEFKNSNKTSKHILDSATPTTSTISKNQIRYIALKSKEDSITKGSNFLLYSEKVSKVVLPQTTKSTMKTLVDHDKLFSTKSNVSSNLILSLTTQRKLKIPPIIINHKNKYKEISLPSLQTRLYPLIKNQKLLLVNNVNFSKGGASKPYHTKIINKTNTKSNLYALTKTLKVHRHTKKHTHKSHTKDPVQAVFIKDQDLRKNNFIRKIENRNVNTALTFENMHDDLKSTRDSYRGYSKRPEKFMEFYASTDKIISRLSNKFSTSLTSTYKAMYPSSTQRFTDTNRRNINNTSTQIIEKYNSFLKKDNHVKRDKFILKPKETYFITLQEKNINTTLTYPSNKMDTINIYTDTKSSIKQKNTTELAKVSKITTPVPGQVISYVNSSPPNSSEFIKNYHKVNLTTSSRAMPKILIELNLTLNKEENNNVNHANNRIKIKEKYNKIIKHININIENKKLNRETGNFITTTPMILSKSLEPTTELRSKTIKYNTYKPPENDHEITSKPHFISNYKIIKSSKYNIVKTPDPGNKLRKAFHLVEKKNDIFYHISNEGVTNKKESKSPSPIKKINFRKDGIQAKSILYPLIKFPSKVHTKVMKRIRLPNMDKEMIAMDTKDFFTNRQLAVKPNMKKKGQKVPINHRIQNIAKVKTKHYAISPVFDKVDGIIKSSWEHYKPKPLFYTNNDDFYRKNIKTRHQNDMLSLRENVNYIKSFPISNPTAPDKTVLDRPIYYLPPSNMKPKPLRDRIDYIRSYLYNAEFNNPTKLPPKSILGTTTGEEPYVDPIYYFRRSGWYTNNFEEKPPMTTSTRKPTKRQRRTIFFLSPTVPYNRYF